MTSNQIDLFADDKNNQEVRKGEQCLENAMGEHGGRGNTSHSVNTHVKIIKAGYIYRRFGILTLFSWPNAY